MGCEVNGYSEVALVYFGGFCGLCFGGRKEGGSSYIPDMEILVL